MPFVLCGRKHVTRRHMTGAALPSTLSSPSPSTAWRGRRRVPRARPSLASGARGTAGGRNTRRLRVVALFFPHIPAADASQGSGRWPRRLRAALPARGRARMSCVLACGAWDAGVLRVALGRPRRCPGGGGGPPCAHWTKPPEEGSGRHGRQHETDGGEVFGAGWSRSPSRRLGRRRAVQGSSVPRRPPLPPPPSFSCPSRNLSRPHLASPPPSRGRGRALCVQGPGLWRRLFPLRGSSVSPRGDALN